MKAVLKSFPCIANMTSVASASLADDSQFKIFFKSFFTASLGVEYTTYDKGPFFVLQK